MKPVRLELDHLRKTPRPARISWLLLAIALAFAADVASSYVKTRMEIEARTAKFARLSGALPAREANAPPGAGPLSKEEFGAAQDTILRLSMPWDKTMVVAPRASSSSTSAGWMPGECLVPVSAQSQSRPPPG